MSLREDLGKAREAATLYDVHGVMPTWAKMAMVDFLRYHGQALIEAVLDAERYRWLMDNATIEAPFGAVSMKTVPPDEPGHAKILWDSAIDTARSKTVDGGGL